MEIDIFDKEKTCGLDFNVWNNLKDFLFFDCKRQISEEL